MRLLLPLLLSCCYCCLLVSEQIVRVDDPLWRIGGKMYFEAKGQSDYIGTREIHSITKSIIKQIFQIYSGDSSNMAYRIWNLECRELYGGYRLENTFL